MSKDNLKDIQILLGVVIVLLIIAVLSFIFFVHKDSFNSEEDVCLKTDNEQFCDSRGFTDNSSVVACYERFKHLNYPEDCVIWREKTKCEVDANSDGCVCDEYPLVDSFFFRNSYEANIILSNGSVYKTEGKVPDYTQAYALVHFTDLTNNISSQIRALTIDGISQCVKSHELTVYDFNCSELKRHIFLGNYFCEQDDSFYEDAMFSICNFPLRVKELRKVFIDKGCDV
jgi:hypothetical protein